MGATVSHMVVDLSSFSEHAQERSPRQKPHLRAILDYKSHRAEQPLPIQALEAEVVLVLRNFGGEFKRLEPQCYERAKRTRLNGESSRLLLLMLLSYSQ